MTQRSYVENGSDPLNVNLTKALSESSFDSNKFGLSRPALKVRTESLTIRVTDETRIVSAFRDTGKKHTTGSIFSVKVDISTNGALGIGVKDLNDNILAVSMLKRSNGIPGAGEVSGIRLGDIVFGVNFQPTREGSKTLLHMLKRENSKRKKYLHIQCWRCHQLCADPVPGVLFPRLDEMFIHSYSLYRTKVFIEWERWNFVEILLRYMMEDIKQKSIPDLRKEIIPSSDKSIEPSSEEVDSVGNSSSKQLISLDLERNILQAKGLRTALCVRIVHTKSQADAVIYVLRVEDIETGLQWVVHRRYRDFYSLHEELSDMNSLVKDIAFPRKSLALRTSAVLIEMRIVALEQYIRKVLHILTVYATMDPHASRSLRHVQNFLGVDKYIDCIHPPPVDDQRFIELMAYRYLNDFTSPACQQCIRFVTTVDLDNILIKSAMEINGLDPSTSSASSSVLQAKLLDPVLNPLGYRPVLEHIHQALAEVESFVIQQHSQQMMQALKDRRPDVNSEDIRVFVRKCVRRQVEASLYMPLRRTIFRIVYSFLATRSADLQKDMVILQSAEPSFFTIDPYVMQAKSLGKAIKAFRDVIQAYLPADQCQLLMHAASAVAELHSECVNHRKYQQNKSEDTLTSNDRSESLNSSNVNRPVTDHIPVRPSLDMKKSEGMIDRLSEHSDRSSLSNDDPTRRSSLIDRSSSLFRRNSFDFRKLFASKKTLSELINSHTSDTTKPQEGNVSSRNILTDINMTDKSTLADPVANMFIADETMPSNILRDARMNNRGYSVDSQSGNNESFIDQIDEDEMSLFKDDESLFTEPTNVGSSVQALIDSKNDNPLKHSLFSSPIANARNNISYSESFPCDESSQSLTPNMDGSAAKHIVGVTSLDDSSATMKINRAMTVPVLIHSDNDEEVDKKALSSRPIENTEESTQSPTINTISLTPTTMSSNTVTDWNPRGKEIVDELKSHLDNTTNHSGKAIQDLIDENPRQSTESKLSGYYEATMQLQQSIVSADDFLPLFTYVLVQSALPHLLLVKEIMTSLVDDEEVMGECGYYLTTLEASAQHISDLAKEYTKHMNDNKSRINNPSTLKEPKRKENLSFIRTSFGGNTGGQESGYYDRNGHATIESEEKSFEVNFNHSNTSKSFTSSTGILKQHHSST